MAILEATLSATFLGQLCVNRWHYISSGDAGPVTPAFGLLSAMGFVPPTSAPWQFTSPSLAKSLQSIVSASFVFEAIYVRNLYVPTDFIETAFNSATVGEYAGETSPPFLAYGFQSNRTRTDIRRGSKRFSGVTETALAEGGVIGAAKMGQLEDLAVRMGAVLSYTSGGASLSFTPAVLSYQEYTTPRGRRAYKKYASEAAQLDHAATGISWAPEPRIRSQVSRQVGRGI